MPFCLKSFTHHFLMSELETPIVLLLTIPGSLGLRKGRVGPQGIWLNVGDGSGSASGCGPSLAGFCRLRHIYMCVCIHTHTHTHCIYTLYVYNGILLQLLLSCLSRVRLCATPQTAAYQAPPSLGFSRQEHWSGLPFPSPMCESEKWKWSRSVVSDS